MNKRELLLPTLSRTSPLLFLILILFNCILYPSYESFPPSREALRVS